METVNSDVIKFVQMIGCGTFGTDLFYGRVPDSKKVPVALWWIIPTHSYVTAHNVTGEDTMTYNFQLAYRNMSLKQVDDEIFRITKEIVGSHCYNLDNFHTINVELISSSPRFQADIEGRVSASVEFKVTVYNILETTKESD